MCRACAAWGPLGAAELLAEVGDPHRFPSADACANSTRTALSPASSAEVQGHPVHQRLNRFGKRCPKAVLYQMGHRAFKDRLYAEFATSGKALASPHRLELLDLLGQGEHSVDQLAQEIGQTLANTSAHLQVGARRGLVEPDKRGLDMVYRLAAPEVFTLCRTLHDLGTARLTEIGRLVETYLTDRATLAAVDVAELRRLAQEGAVTPLDARPEHEYRQGHIPSTRSIPVAELEQRLAEVPHEPPGEAAPEPISPA